MNFINNWRQQLAIAESATSAELELPDGEYLLTLSDGLGVAATRWEYILAAVASGTATLQRAQEGSDDQDWPVGSWIYCSITSGTLGQVFAELASLRARVDVLENALRTSETIEVTSGVFTDEVATVTGWLTFPGGGGAFGNGTPQSINVPGHGQLDIDGLYFVAIEGQPKRFAVQLVGDVTLAGVEKLVIEGIGTLAVADSAPPDYAGGAGRTSIIWEIGPADWVDGSQRSVEFIYPVT